MSIIERYITLAGSAVTDYYSAKAPLNLYEPVDYVLGLGGKRLRPALCMAACHFYGGDGTSAGSAAMGLEMFHNFTLLHDDIMDGASIRRNQPTVHVKWNANTAILSGDAMMILANQMMLNVPDAVLKPVQQLFLKTALEVCEGQQYDMDFEHRNDVDVDEYIEMIRLKTAVLIAASLKIGALIGGASEKDASLLYEFGVNLGLAFQLQDDYLDVYGNSAEFGKSIGGDIVCNKKTFLLINCIANANDEQRKVLDYWLTKTDFDRNEKIAAVTQLYNELNIASISKMRMEQYYQTALLILDQLSIADEYKNELKVFAGNTLFRSK